MTPEIKKALDLALDRAVPSILSPGWVMIPDKDFDAIKQARSAPVQEPVANNWSVFNTGAEVWDKLSLADAVVELTPSRLERGWSAVCVIDKDNPPLYTTPPAAPVQPVMTDEKGRPISFWGGKSVEPIKQPAPASWMETVTANLVREGVNKHKARELAEHFYGLKEKP